MPISRCFWHAGTAAPDRTYSARISWLNLTDHLFSRFKADLVNSASYFKLCKQQLITVLVSRVSDGNYPQM